MMKICIGQETAHHMSVTRILTSSSMGLVVNILAISYGFTSYNLAHCLNIFHWTDLLQNKIIFWIPEPRRTSNYGLNPTPEPFSYKVQCLEYIVWESAIQQNKKIVSIKCATMLLKFKASIAATSSGLLNNIV